jgi:butyryl-CoA dehydrogenase
MDFQFTEEQKMLRKTIRAFAEGQLKPRAAQWDEKEEVPWESIKRAAAQQLFGIIIPTEYGGSGGGIIELIISLEEIARVCVNTAAYIFSAAGCSQRINYFGSETQKNKYLPLIASGKKLACHAMTEPEAGSDERNIATTAKLVNGYYVVNGTKCFISRGQVSDIFLLYVRFVETGKNGYLIVEKGMPGFFIGKVEKTIGFRGNPSTELIFNDCKVPKENLLEKSDAKAALKALNLSRCCNPAMCLGIAQGAFEAALNYSKVRQQFGREICEFQGIQWMLADMYIKLEAARLLIYRAAVNAAKGYPSALEASIAKTYANEAAFDVVNIALQIHGGYGLSRDFPIERMLRDVRGFAIAGGTTQIQRIIIASQLLERKLSQREKATGERN